MDSIQDNIPTRKHRPSKAARDRACERYRAYNNRRSLSRIDEMTRIVVDNMIHIDFPYDITDLATGRRLLTSGKLAELDALLVEMRSAELDIQMKIHPQKFLMFESENCVEAPKSDENELIVTDSPLASTSVEDTTSPIEASDSIESASVFIPSEDSDLRQIDEDFGVNLILKVKRSQQPEGEVLPPDVLPIFEHPTGCCIYAGPGSGKTTLVEKIPSQYRGMIVDTDDLQSGYRIPPRSIVFTNRPDVLASFPGVRIAVIPVFATWYHRCKDKCGDRTKPSWYLDLLKTLSHTFVLRTEKYFADVIRLHYCA